LHIGHVKVRDVRDRHDRTLWRNHIAGGFTDEVSPDDVRLTLARHNRPIRAARTGAKHRTSP
jgi:hypothetical protein